MGKILLTSCVVFTISVSALWCQDSLKQICHSSKTLNQLQKSAGTAKSIPIVSSILEEKTETLFVSRSTENIKNIDKKDLLPEMDLNACINRLGTVDSSLKNNIVQVLEIGTYEQKTFFLAIQLTRLNMALLMSTNGGIEIDSTDGHAVANIYRAPTRSCASEGSCVQWKVSWTGQYYCVAKACGQMPDTGECLNCPVVY